MCIRDRLNIALDPPFIFVFDMGVSGAALATIISQFVGFVLLLKGTTQGGNLRIRLRNVTFSKYYYSQIINGGMPSLCRQGLGSVATICLNLMAGPYGDAAIAAMSVVGRVMNLAASVVTGFGQGFQPVCGFNYGAFLYDRVKDCLLYTSCSATYLFLIRNLCGKRFGKGSICGMKKDWRSAWIWMLPARRQRIPGRSKPSRATARCSSGTG